MPFWGCERCGVALNESEVRELPVVMLRMSAEWKRPLCPECRHPLERVSVTDALALVRERAEADRRRAQTQLSAYAQGAAAP